MDKDINELVEKLKSFQQQSAVYAEELKIAHECEEEKYRKLEDTHNSLQQVYAETIRVLAEAIDSRSKFTQGHSERVRRYCDLIGQRLYLSDEELKVLDIAATLHDIGRVGVEQTIWEKPGKLTDTEFESAKSHAAIGEKMLPPIPFLDRVAKVVRHHHEKYDGSGYPDCINGENIPLSARILAVADAFDAMTSERPYRERIDPIVALEEIKSLSGTQFDPLVIEAFISVWKKMYS
ncbi:HD-GYP domain-containing protein [Candidatus Desantisbacteria bacterium]|nr:HD-GYP domain-containing protein [Candidatus Desantisbacteria bacterium]